MSDTWDNALYRNVYEQTFEHLMARRDSGVSAEAIRNQLEAEYVAAGINWVGKGEVWHVTQEATIAAYEAFLASWDRHAAMNSS